MSHRKLRARLLASLTLFSVMALALPAQAGATPEHPGVGLVKLAAVIVLLGALGIGLGSFGLTVNNVFRQRSAASFELMCNRPKLSLLVGVLVTALGFGLLAILHGAGPLQLLVLLCYLGGLGIFGLASAARLSAQHIQTSPLGELPGAGAHVRGGVVLTAINAVPIIGTVLFVGILLTGVGASLLGYFARFGNGGGEGQQEPATADEPDETE